MLDLRSNVKVGIPESFKLGWYPHKITGSSHLNTRNNDTIPAQDKSAIEIKLLLLLLQCCETCLFSLQLSDPAFCFTLLPVPSLQASGFNDSVSGIL